MSELLRRRVPQFVGVYLAGGWGVLEFTDFLVNHYVLSPHLTDFALLSWALMTPTVFMLAWYHGAPGRDRWMLVEQIGIPINLALAGLLLFVLFRGKELGAATRAIEVETEAGETVERVIPKSEFRKHIAVFFFDNESADTTLDWLQYGIPWGLVDDLQQDIFLDVQAGYPTVAADQGMTERLRDAGYADGLRVPLTLKRDIAEELHRGRFVTGTLTSSGNGFTVTTQLYETARGKLLEERTYSGNDPFTLIDQASLQLRQDLEIPSQHIEETRDLPVAELHTNSPSAYRARVAALRDMTIDDDWSSAARELDAAVAEDPTYALAQLNRFGVQIYLNDSETAAAALQAAMEHSYKLPERIQFLARAEYYMVVRQDMERTQSVLGMWSELYPDDITAFAMLAQVHVQLNEREKAIEDLKRVLELDPGQYDALRQIGQLHQQLGQFDAAESYYRQYADRFPEDPRSFTSLAGLARLKGDHETARELYERAQVTSPENPDYLTDLAWAEYDLGDFDAALGELEDALAASSTAAQRAASYGNLRSYYASRGQSKRAVEYLHDQWAELRASQPPLNVLFGMVSNLSTYVDAGMTQAAMDTLASIRSRVQPPFDVLVNIGELQIALASDDAAMIEAALPKMDALIEGWGLEAARFMRIAGNGRLLELRGDCQQAIIAYERAWELQPTSSRYPMEIGRCQRKLGSLEAAESNLQESLRVSPYSGQAHLELARVYADMGEREKAIEQTGTSLEIWKDADPQFRYAAEARQLMDSLRE